MASLSKVQKDRSGWDGGKLLKGSDLESDSITLFFHEVKEAPKAWNTPLVAIIDEEFGCKAVGLNATNCNKLGELLGDDYASWGGHDVTFNRVFVTNPKTNMEVYGMEVESAKKSKRKVKVPF